MDSLSFYQLIHQSIEFFMHLFNGNLEGLNEFNSLTGEWMADDAVALLTVALLSNDARGDPVESRMDSGMVKDGDAKRDLVILCLTDFWS